MRYNALLAIIRASLQRLLHAQRGMVVLTAGLEQLRRELLSDVIPHEWLASSHPSSKPLALYMRDLRSRIAFVRAWAAQGISSRITGTGLRLMFCDRSSKSNANGCIVLTEVTRCRDIAAVS